MKRASGHIDLEHLIVFDQYRSDDGYVILVPPSRFLIKARFFYIEGTVNQKFDDYHYYESVDKSWYCADEKKTGEKMWNNYLKAPFDFKLSASFFMKAREVAFFKKIFRRKKTEIRPVKNNCFKISNIKEGNYNLKIVPIIYNFKSHKEVNFQDIEYERSGSVYDDFVFYMKSAAFISLPIKDYTCDIYEDKAVVFTDMENGFVIKYYK